MDTVLLTGGSGFVGANLSELLLRKGYKLVLLNRKPVPEAIRRKLNGLGGFEEVTADVADAGEIRRAIANSRAEYVIHAAAMTSIGDAELPGMTRTVATNCVGTMNLLEAARAADVRKFVYISSCGVYGPESQEQDLICEEHTPMRPQSTYEITKFAAEQLAHRYAALTGMPVCAVRICDTYGPWERETEFRANMSAPLQVMRCAMRGETARLSKPGKTVWAYIRDVAEAIVRVMECENHHRVYHASSIYPFSMLDFARELSRYYPGFQAEICKNPEDANIHFFSQKDNGRFSMDNVREDCGFIPRYTLAKAVKDYCAWWEEHREFQ